MNYMNVRQRRILLADDDEDDRLFFIEALNKVTPEVIIESEIDGVQLMHKLRQTDELPGMIFLDLNMPYKDGKECLIEIKSTPNLNEIPVIIFSTSSHHRDVEDTYRHGANLYVQKPSGFDEMVSTLKKILTLDWTDYMPKPDRSKFIL